MKIFDISVADSEIEKTVEAMNQIKAQISAAKLNPNASSRYQNRKRKHKLRELGRAHQRLLKSRKKMVAEKKNLEREHIEPTRKELFIELSKEYLSKEQFLEIWSRVNEALNK